MRQLLLAFSTAAILTTGALARSSQTTANFSGHWVVVDAKPARPGYDQFWFGTEAKVTHEGTKLAIVRIAPEPAREAHFDLSGSENHNVYTVQGRRIARDSRVTSKGTSLLISTDTATED